MKLYSDRNIPLIVSNSSLEKFENSELIRPIRILTVEDYCKWYSIFVIVAEKNNNGAVKSIQIFSADEHFPNAWDSMENEMADLNKSFYGDHKWHPYGIQLFAKKINATVDNLALAALTLKWYEEFNDKELKDL